MRTPFSLAALMLAAVAAVPAAAQVPGYVSTVTAGTPDPNHKVPAFNAVPDAGVATWSIAEPLSVLTHGHIYTYCVTFQDVNFSGTAKISYKISQLGTTLQAGYIKTNLTTAPGDVWGYCLNGKALPGTTGTATLSGTVTFATSPNATAIHLNVPILIQ